MTETLDEILDDLFHGCAFAAYVELAVACRGVPDSEATRRLAFRYFEEELAAGHHVIARETRPPATVREAATQSSQPATGSGGR